MRRICITSIAAVVILSNLACSEFNRPATVAAQPASPAAPQPGGDAAYLDKSAIRQDSGKDAAPSTVDTALEWAKKYADEAEKTARLTADNVKLREDMDKLAKELAGLAGDLARAKEQLAQAGEMIKEMDDGLKKWKTDVLGFRQEMLQSHQTQMNAMAKILKLLGGEVTPTAGTATTQPAAVAGGPR